MYRSLIGNEAASDNTEVCKHCPSINDHYVHDPGCFIDRHAPLICGRIKKEPADWLSDTYLKAKSVRHQFEHMWRKDRSQLSRARLHTQIARCNTIINRDKAEYYSNVINDNSCDPKKLRQALRQVLNKGHKITLLPHQSDNSLANQFASFFTQKMKRIQDMFLASTTTIVLPTDLPPTCRISVRSPRMTY